MRTFYILSILLFFIPLNALMAQSFIPESSLKDFSLKIDLKPNTSYRFVATHTRNITQDMMGNSMEINQETSVNYKFEIESNTSEGLKIKAFFEKIELDLEMPQGRTTIDSKNNNLSEFSQIINKPFYIYITAQGQVIKIEELEELFRYYENTDQSLLQEFFTEKNLIAFIENSFNVFPMDSINMGESWNIIHYQRLNNQFDLIFDKSFTLEGLSEDMAWIAVENTIINSGSETLAFEAASIDGKQEGIIEVDRSTGLILFSDIKHEFQGVLKSSGIEIPVRISLGSNLRGERL